MSEAMVIPDGITPVVGWRAWKIEGGKLVSPTYPYVWPQRAAAEAKCRVASSPFNFPRPALYVRPHAGSHFEFSTGELKVSLGPRDRWGMPQGDGPTILVSSTVEWPEAKDFYAHADTCPSQNCSCGFYVTKNLEEAKRYGDVVGQVAVWGNVVEHDGGWRGQYAYPQAVYADHPTVLKLKLADYGVPVLPLSEIGGQGEPLATGGVIAAPPTLRAGWYEWPLRVLGLAGRASTTSCWQDNAARSRLVQVRPVAVVEVALAKLHDAVSRRARIYPRQLAAEQDCELGRAARSRASELPATVRVSVVLVASRRTPRFTVRPMLTVERVLACSADGWF